MQKQAEHGEEGQEKEWKYLKKSERVNNGKEFDLRFDEIKGSLVTKGFSSGFKFLYYTLFGHKEQGNREPSSKEDFELLEKEMPILKPQLNHQLEKEIRYTWIGHSTAVIQVGQDNLLIDPVFSDRCFPSNYVGPKRYRKPACTVADLKKIDLVLVSHDHYDHLDEVALSELHKLYKPTFIAGLGSKQVFPAKCALREMDWMDEIDILINGRIYKVTFVPVCHWSRRGAFDYNTRLWGGFVIKTPYGHKIFYSGDTAYTGVFKEIGEKYGPFDLAILPIGAYKPRELLKAQHVDPQQAVQIHQDIKSKKSVGVHWGTFPLGFEAFYQPKIDLEQAKAKLGVPVQDFITVLHGESFIV